MQRRAVIALVALFAGTTCAGAQQPLYSRSTSCHDTRDPRECASVQVETLTPSLPCSEAQSLVRTEGAVVLSTGPHTYDRFVSEDIYCEPDAFASPAFEPTLDNRQCMIGYYCKQKSATSQR
jgi:hypothetical protein